MLAQAEETYLMNLDAVEAGSPAVWKKLESPVVARITSVVNVGMGEEKLSIRSLTVP